MKETRETRKTKTTRRLPWATALACHAVAGAALAQQPALPATQLEPVVVTANVSERRAFDSPFAVGIVEAEELRRAGPMVNLSEALQRVPGITVNSRNNHAQDLQIASRGFGARAGFGVRGMRLYTDGIPATMPDGQGQVTHFDLAGAQRIEVLRGPFSALYGNSSGGVISLFSAPATRREFELGADAGGDGARQLRLGAQAPLGNGWDLRVQGSRFDTDGPRPHSAARRELANARLGWRGDADSLTLLLNTIEQTAQDPLGLTRSQFDAGTPKTTPQALQFDTRKASRQTQVGAQWTHRFAQAGALQSSAVSVYSGQRAVTQWQAIPVAVQQPPTQPGGVIDFDRAYRGLDARWTWRWQRDAQRGAQLVAGVTLETQDEDRRGFENFVAGPGAGGPRLGATGALRRDERDSARTRDAYLQGELDLARDVTATLGVRSGVLKIDSRDRYMNGANADDSGALEFPYTTPVAALLWRASPALNLYANAGRGFEAPTLAELAYGPQPGFNLALRPQRSRQLEVGAKWRDAPRRLSGDVALFRIATRDEIGVLSNTGGRATFQNVGRTTRQGIEIAGRWQATPALRAQVALTWLDAVYSDGFSTPNGPVAAGRRVAGAASRSLFTELAWQATADTDLAFELRGQGRVPVNDLNTDFAGGAGVAAVRLGRTVRLPEGQLLLSARVDNLFDRRHAGSVIVNEGNGRYFEPAAGRTGWLGAAWRVGF
jgi:iron complex outermembrane receptor protein